MEQEEFFENWLAQQTVERIERDNKNAGIYGKLQSALLVAEAKHPVFATSFDEGLMRVVEELGEIAQARNKSQGAVREKEEVLDLLCVVWRLAREDYAG